MKATTKDLRSHTPELLAATDRNPAFGLWAGSEPAAALSVEEEVRALRKPRPLV